MHITSPSQEHNRSVSPGAVGSEKGQGHEGECNRMCQSAAPRRDRDTRANATECVSRPLREGTGTRGRMRPNVSVGRSEKGQGHEGECDRM
eukprot:1178817-Prorocentrum_minimum.AAC.1